jgi:hypothetical protein
MSATGAPADVRPDTLWRNKQSRMQVLVWRLGFLRVAVGRSTKTPAVFYESLHDGELTARSAAEFQRLFAPVPMAPTA